MGGFVKNIARSLLGYCCACSNYKVVHELIKLNINSTSNAETIEICR